MFRPDLFDLLLDADTAMIAHLRGEMQDIGKKMITITDPGEGLIARRSSEREVREKVVIIVGTLFMENLQQQSDDTLTLVARDRHWSAHVQKDVVGRERSLKKTSNEFERSIRDDTTDRLFMDGDLRIFLSLEIVRKECYSLWSCRQAETYVTDRQFQEIDGQVENVLGDRFVFQVLNRTGETADDGCLQ